jgi:hypothetical protein
MTVLPGKHHMVSFKLANHLVHGRQGDVQGKSQASPGICSSVSTVPGTEKHVGSVNQYISHGGLPGCCQHSIVTHNGPKSNGHLRQNASCGDSPFGTHWLAGSGHRYQIYCMVGGNCCANHVDSCRAKLAVAVEKHMPHAPVS